MTAKMVVLGAGYAGVGAVKQLEAEIADLDADLVWVSKNDHHLVLHEIHRAIRDPGIQTHLTIPIEEIKSPDTRFVNGEVIALDTSARQITLADESIIEYDYLLIGLGSQTAFYGINGLEEYAFTLKSLDDALRIHENVAEAAQHASKNDPVQVVVGGAGLTGIQNAGEIAEFRDMHCLPVEITLVEASGKIYSDQNPDMQAALRDRLLERDIEILTNTRIAAVDESKIRFERRNPMDYEILLWAGGVTGQDTLSNTGLENTRGRIVAEATFETNDERVFAVGDAALIERDEKGVVPPTAEAARDAAKVAGTNVARTIRGESLDAWSYTNQGVLVSVGKNTVAHNIKGVSISPFTGPAARLLEKTITARWIASMASWRLAARAWPSL